MRFFILVTTLFQIQVFAEEMNHLAKKEKEHEEMKYRTAKHECMKDNQDYKGKSLRDCILKKKDEIFNHGENPHKQ